MADSLGMALTELVRKAELEQGTDSLREGVRVLSQTVLSRPTYPSEGPWGGMGVHPGDRDSRVTLRPSALRARSGRPGGPGHRRSRRRRRTAHDAESIARSSAALIPWAAATTSGAAS